MLRTGDDPDTVVMDTGTGGASRRDDSRRNKKRGDGNDKLSHT